MEMLKTYAKTLESIPLWSGVISSVFLAFIFRESAADALLGLAAVFVGLAVFRSAMRPALKD